MSDDFKKIWHDYYESAQYYDDNTEDVARRFFIIGRESRQVIKPKRTIAQIIPYGGGLCALSSDGKLFMKTAQHPQWFLISDLPQEDEK